MQYPQIICLFPNIAFLSLLTILLNSNYTLLYFKKKSFVLYWKMYNVCMFYISIYYLKYRENYDQFSDHWLLTESIIYCAGILFSVILVIMSISLYQGYSNIQQKFGVFGIIAFISIIIYLSLFYYIKDWDYERKIFCNSISVRSIIISSGIDLAIWMSHQVYQIIKYPNVLQVTSKITINWML